MATKLYDYSIEHGYTALEKELESYDTARLFAELDDTVQMDMLEVSNAEWAFMRNKKTVYNAILRELLKRVK